MNSTAGWLHRRLPELVAAHGVGVRVPDPPVPPKTPIPVDTDKVAGMTDGERGADYTALRDDALISVEPQGSSHAVLVLCGRDGHGRVRWLHHGRAAVRT